MLGVAPGLAGGATGGGQGVKPHATHVRSYSIRPFRELRIIARENSSPTIRLCWTPVGPARQGGQSTDFPGHGTAEIFGAELAPDKEYVIAPSERCAVYSWGGCTLQIRGSTQQEYESGNQAMKEFLNVSTILDAMRQLSEIRRKIGPRILITGAPSAGKSSLCQILGNYAIRKGWSPTYVELDPRGSTDKDALKLLPGTIGATTLEGVAPPVDGPDGICFFYGHYEADDNPQLFLKLCHVLSAAIHARFENNIAASHRAVVERDSLNVENGPQDAQPASAAAFPLAASGMIINAPPQPSAAFLAELVSTFDVNVIFVVDDPSLKTFLADKYHYVEPESVEHLGVPGADDSRLSYHPPAGQLSSTDAFDRKVRNKNVSSPSQRSTASPNGDIAHQGISVVGLSKAEGVVAVNPERLRFLRKSAWRRYFLGSADGGAGEERPVLIRIRASEYNFLTLDATTVSAGALPAGQHSFFVGDDSLRSWCFSGNLRTLVNSILAVSTSRQKTQVAWSNVAFFVLVRHVEEVARVTDGSSASTSGPAVDDPDKAGPGGTADFYVDLLAPRAIFQDGNSGGLPSNFLIVGDKSVKWSLESG